MSDIIARDVYQILFENWRPFVAHDLHYSSKMLEVIHESPSASGVAALLSYLDSAHEQYRQKPTPDVLASIHKAIGVLHAIEFPLCTIYAGHPELLAHQREVLCRLIPDREFTLNCLGALIRRAPPEDRRRFLVLALNLPHIGAVQLQDALKTCFEDHWQRIDVLRETLLYIAATESHPKLARKIHDAFPEVLKSLMTQSREEDGAAIQVLIRYIGATTNLLSITEREDG